MKAFDENTGSVGNGCDGNKCIAGLGERDTEEHSYGHDLTKVSWIFKIFIFILLQATRTKNVSK